MCNRSTQALASLSIENQTKCTDGNACVLRMHIGGASKWLALVLRAHETSKNQISNFFPKFSIFPIFLIFLKIFLEKSLEELRKLGKTFSRK